jgi:hypothetical protein
MQGTTALVRTGLLIGSFMLGSCLGDGSSNCLPGTLQCECTGGLCQTGLLCVSNFCVDPNAPSTTTTASTSTTQGLTFGTTLSDTGDSQDTDEPSGGPIIEEFIVDKENLEYGELLTFTAIVSDPDGIEDIKSGRLTAPTFDVGYFMNVGGATWSLVTTWQAINEAEGGILNNEIQFEAEFTDQADLVATRTVSVLVCESGFDVCSDGCQNLTSDENCGSCGNDCGPDYYCYVDYYGAYCEYSGGGGFVPDDA